MGWNSQTHKCAAEARLSSFSSQHEPAHRNFNLPSTSKSALCIMIRISLCSMISYRALLVAFLNPHAPCLLPFHYGAQSTEHRSRCIVEATHVRGKCRPSTSDRNARDHDPDLNEARECARDMLRSRSISEVSS